MSATENKLKQRIVGALVLIALAVIFLPMLLKQDDPVREVTVQTPTMPSVSEVPQFPVEPVEVPEPVLDDAWDEALITEEPSPASSTPTAPIAADTATEQLASQEDAAQDKEPQHDTPVVTPKPEQQVVEAGIDNNTLPVSWSIQLASLTNKSNAEALRDTFRKKQYNAYVRSSADIHRVLIGPLIKRSEAQALCKSLKTRENQECFVVRYAPAVGQ